MKGRNKMKRKIFITLLAGCMCLLCACSSPAEESSAGGHTEPSIFEDSDGNIVYNYNFDEDGVPPADKGDLKKRATEAPAFAVAKNGISREEAEKILDESSSYRMYLPGKTADFKKFYNQTLKYEEKDYYSFSFYAEKNSVRMFVGTDVLVACDGSEVLRLDAANSYQQVEMNSAQDDKDAKQMYPDAKISAQDALFSLLDKDAEKLGLTENINDYTFEADDELVAKKSVNCYQFIPKLRYESSVQLGSAIYVASDDSGRIFALDNEKHEYDIVS